jgi:hypothetical protein
MLELLRTERRPMDQKTPLDDEETVRFAYFARRNPAIHLFRLRRTIFASSGYCEVLTRRGSVLGLLPAHDRLSSWYLDALLSMISVNWQRHHRNPDPDSKSAECMFSPYGAVGKVCHVRIWHAHFMIGPFRRMVVADS